MTNIEMETRIKELESEKQDLINRFQSFEKAQRISNEQARNEVLATIESRLKLEFRDCKEILEESKCTKDNYESLSFLTKNIMKTLKKVGCNL